MVRPRRPCRRRAAGVRRALQLAALFFFALRNVEPFYVAAGNHHAEYRAFGQGQNAAYHGFFVFFEMFAVFRFFARIGQDAFAYAHHAEDVFCGTLPPRAADVIFFLGIFHRYLVEDFNQDGETDGGVEIAFWGIWKWKLPQSG